jgi:hypothetical protein
MRYTPVYRLCYDQETDSFVEGWLVEDSLTGGIFCSACGWFGAQQEAHYQNRVWQSGQGSMWWVRHCLKMWTGYDLVIPNPPE